MVRTLLQTFAFGLVVAMGSAGQTSAADNNCTIAKDGDNDVVKACQAGGIKRAKVIMKAMSKAARDKGMKVDCDSCHKNETDWALTKDGQDQFKKMVALVKEEKK